MRIEFINATGGSMFVDESRKEEYIAAGYMLAANVIDSVAVELKEPVEKKRATRKKKEE